MFCPDVESAVLNHARWVEEPHRLENVFRFLPKKFYLYRTSFGGGRQQIKMDRSVVNFLTGILCSCLSSLALPKYRVEQLSATKLRAIFLVGELGLFWAARLSYFCWWMEALREALHVYSGEGMPNLGVRRCTEVGFFWMFSGSCLFAPQKQNACAGCMSSG